MTNRSAMFIGLGLLVLALISSISLRAATPASNQWQTVTSSDGSSPEPRHESGAVAVNGKLYLLGGRNMRAVQVYDPDAQTWTSLGPTPMELHHFQPVAVGNSIYVVGGFTCCYPNEELLTDIHVFDTETATWSVVGGMPASRNRGSAAAVVREGLIYIVGGNTQGHSGGFVPWFDEYNPATGEWRILPDAPNARDHFSAVIVNDYLVAAAGRQTDQPNPFTNPVLATDIYDFVKGEWRSTSDIPTARAGAIAAPAGDEVLVAGGEINTTPVSLDTVEAYNVYSKAWRTLSPLGTGRHSGGGAVINGQFHMLAGSLNTGGAPETDAHESLLLDETKSIDFDADGLSNNDERNVHGTDPANADSDFDSLSDADEVNTHGTDPVQSDTDSDGLDDGVEINDWNSNPLKADTDEDGLSDYEEVFSHNTNPTLADTDSDGLNDQIEVNVHQTDPANTDSDADGLNDFNEVQLGTNPNDADSDDDGLLDGNDPDPLGNGNSDDSNTGGNNSGGSDNGNADAGTDAGSTDEGNADAGNTDTGNTDMGGDDTGNTTDAGSSGGGAAYWLLMLLVVGTLSRARFLCVNVSSNEADSLV